MNINLKLKEQDIIVLLGIIQSVADQEIPTEQAYLGEVINQIKIQVKEQKQPRESSDRTTDKTPKNKEKKMKVSARKTPLGKRFGTGR